MKDKTYLEIILDCFASMDFERLQFHLNDEYSYQDTTKEVFLKKIERLLNENNKAGDTKLLIYKGQCAGEFCYINFMPFPGIARI